MFESKSFRFKQAFGKIMLYTRMRRKMVMMVGCAGFTLFTADLILTYGIISGSGWGCYKNDKNQSECQMDLGYRWLNSDEKTAGINIAEGLGIAGLAALFLGCILMIVSAVLNTIGMTRQVLLARLILCIIACYFIIVAIVMYIGSYGRLKSSVRYGYPNLLDDYGTSFYLTFIGWLILALAITFDGMGLVIPYGFESSTDIFLRKWLEKHYVFQKKKYVQMKDRDMPEMDVQQLAQAQ